MAPRRSTKKTMTPELAVPVSPEPEAPVVETAPAPKAKKAPAKPRKATPKPVVEPVVEPMAETPKPEVLKVPDLALPAQACTVLEAIQDGKAVELIFLDAETNPPRTFEPRQLAFDALSQAWFVWGWDRRYNAERHHRLDQLAEVNLVEGVGRSAQGPYKEGVPANQIGGWLGGEPIPVKATLLKQWIFAVKQAPAPFPDFTIVDQEEGKALVSFTATDLRAIARWCMQFGDGLQVLEPQRLVDRIKQVGLHWAGKAAAQPAAAAPAPRASGRPERAPEAAKPSGRPERTPEPHRRAEQPRREAPEPARREAPEPTRREAPESPAPKSKPGKVEIRFERL